MYVDEAVGEAMHISLPRWEQTPWGKISWPPMHDVDQPDRVSGASGKLQSNQLHAESP